MFRSSASAFHTPGFPQIVANDFVAFLRQARNGDGDDYVDGDGDDNDDDDDDVETLLPMTIRCDDHCEKGTYWRWCWCWWVDANENK